MSEPTTPPLENYAIYKKKRKLYNLAILKLQETKYSKFESVRNTVYLLYGN